MVIAEISGNVMLHGMLCGIDNFSTMADRALVACRDRRGDLRRRRRQRLQAVPLHARGSRDNVLRPERPVALKYPIAGLAICCCCLAVYLRPTRWTASALALLQAVAAVDHQQDAVDIAGA
jgi:hypothetical protein